MVRIDEAVEDEGDNRDGPGLIDLDMKAFGSGNMSDPLRHAMGLRNAQDQCKMRMWNGFPQLFQNTIFHGEQDAEIKHLRHSGSLADRLARGRQLKDEGNTALRGASGGAAGGAGASTSAEPPRAEQDPRSEELRHRVDGLKADVAAKEQELRALRRELAAAQAELAGLADSSPPPAPEPGHPPPGPDVDAAWRERLEKAITSYERAAGLLRYVECVRPDWKNDDGSYKGIEDEHLHVDASALEGAGPEAEEARELVASCYLNIALVCQKLGDFEMMRAACDEVLQSVNPHSVKALYRRAQARVAPASSLDSDVDAAIQDLHTAAQLSPQDKDVRGLLARLKAERKAKERSDRSAFAGLFDRGQVVTTDPRTEGDAPPKLDLNDPKVQAMLDIHPGPGGFT